MKCDPAGVLRIPWIALGLFLMSCAESESSFYDLPAGSTLSCWTGTTYSSLLGNPTTDPNPYVEAYRASADSVVVEAFAIREFTDTETWDFGFGDPGWQMTARGIRSDGVIRNASGTSARLVGFRAYYLSEEGERIGEHKCDVGRVGQVEIRCGFSTVELRPGYIADFTARVPHGPSQARRDTAEIEIHFCMDR